MDIFYPFS